MTAITDVFVPVEIHEPPANHYLGQHKKKQGQITLFAHANLQSI